MFSQNTIDTLAKRVGWDKPVQPTAIVLDVANLQSDSGLTVSGIFALATTENVYALAPNARQSMADFNVLLSDMRVQAALKVLKTAFAVNPTPAYLHFKSRIASGATTYDAFALANIDAFDMAIGWQLVVDAVTLMATSDRINAKERAVKVTYDQLKMELDGLSENGGKGILYRLSSAYKTLIASLFIEPQRKPRATFRSY